MLRPFENVNLTEALVFVCEYCRSNDAGCGGSVRVSNGSSCLNCHDLENICESLNQLLQDKESQVKLLEQDLEVQKGLNNKLLENICEQQREIVNLKGGNTTNEHYSQMKKREGSHLETYVQVLKPSSSVKTIGIRKHENGSIETSHEIDVSHLEASRKIETEHEDNIYAADLERIVIQDHNRHDSTMSDFSMQSVETDHANHVSTHGNLSRMSFKSDTVLHHHGQGNGSVQPIETEILHMQPNADMPPHRPDRSTSLGRVGMVKIEHNGEASVTSLNGDSTPRRKVINGEPWVNNQPVKKITLVNPIKNLRMNLRHKKQGERGNGVVSQNLLHDCPVCHLNFPAQSSELERAHHVNNHFMDN